MAAPSTPAQTAGSSWPSDPQRSRVSAPPRRVLRFRLQASSASALCRANHFRPLLAPSGFFFFGFFFRPDPESSPPRLLPSGSSDLRPDPSGSERRRSFRASTCTHYFSASSEDPSGSGLENRKTDSRNPVRVCGERTRKSGARSARDARLVHTQLRFAQRTRECDGRPQGCVRTVHTRCAGRA